MTKVVSRLAILTTLCIASTAFATDPYATAPPYGHTVAGGVVVPLLTTGQQVPLTGGPSGSTYRWVGIPDGLGAVGAGGNLSVFCNHELNRGTGVPAGPLGAGTRVSKVELVYGGTSGAVVSASDAIQNVYAGEPAVLQAPGSRSAGRFCSGHLGGPWEGLDRPIFFNGEETGGAATFDGQGGSAFATADGNLYQLPRVGHSNWENVVVVPGTGNKTVLLGLEDAGTLTSQVYMYAGDKVAGSADVLSRNGLDNGNLYVLSWTDALRHDEATFTAKGTSVPVEWHQVNYNQTDVQLETQSQAVGSFNFVRVEDGAAYPNHPGEFYFVTTGSPGSVNPYGRLYRLAIDVANPTAAATLTLVLDGSEGIVSPDNIDINSAGTMLICEDPNYNLGIAPLNLTRDTYLWKLDLATLALSPVVEMDRAAAKAHALAADPLNTVVAATDLPGFWEFSGVVTAENWLGANAWLFVVQAHALRINPATETVEGGQLLLLNLDAATGTENTLGADVSEQDGVVRIDWAMSDRGALDGFRVTRTSAATGEAVDLTPSLLSAAATSFEDVPGAGAWVYQVEAVQQGTVRAATGSLRVQVGAASLGLRLDRPQPNPSHGPVQLSFSVPSNLVGSHAELSLFDVGGRRVATLFSGTLRADHQSVSWSGRDLRGATPTGVLFARLTTSAGSVTRRVLRTSL